MLEGDLLTNQVEQVLLDLGAQEATGCLTVLDALSEEAEVYLKEGLVYSVYVPGRRPLLGARLMSSGALAPEALAEALEIQRTELQGWRLGELLVHLGYVDRELVESFVSEQLIDMLGDLLGWQVDTWRFRKNKKARQDVAPPADVPTVLTRVHERRSLREQLRREIGGPDAIPVLSAREAAADDVVLGPNEWALLCKVDAERSIADLAIDCGYTIFEASQVVAALVRAGLVDVEVVPEADPEADATSRGGLETSEWADLPDPSHEELAESVSSVARALARMYGEEPPAEATASETIDIKPPVEDDQPTAWQDHQSWVDEQRRIAEEEARVARVEAERVAAQLREVEEAEQAAQEAQAEAAREARAEAERAEADRAEAERAEAEQRAEEDRERRRLEAEEIARAVEEARQSELQRIERERSKDQEKKERKERKAVEAQAWEDHAAWLWHERFSVEDEAWQAHGAWLLEQRVAAEEAAWIDHAHWLSEQRAGAEEAAWVDHARWLADERAVAEESAWAEYAAGLAADRAAAEAVAWDEHGQWLLAERARVEEAAWEDHLTWVAEQLAIEADRLEQERLAEEARLLEEERLAEQARLLEEERLAEQARLLEEERLAEEARIEAAALEAEIEAARVADEQRRAEEQAAVQGPDPAQPAAAEGSPTSAGADLDVSSKTAVIDPPVLDPPVLDPPDAELTTEMVMPLITTVDASSSSWESYDPSPAAALSALSRELPAQRSADATESEESMVDDIVDDRPEPIVDRSLTDTASLLRELSGLFHTDDPEPAKPTTPAPRPAPPPPPPPKKRKGLFGRG